MSKSGVESLTKSLDAEYSKRNIRIKYISPSPINSNSLRYVFADESENNLLNKKIKKYILLGRIGSPHDIT